RAASGYRGALQPGRPRRRPAHRVQGVLAAHGGPRGRDVERGAAGRLRRHRYRPRRRDRLSRVPCVVDGGMNARALDGVRATCLALFLGACLLSGPFALSQDRDWIEESNRHAQLLLEVLAKYAPETAASLGVEGYDENIFDLGPRFSERQQADLDAVAAKLADARESARDPRVQQDLDILVQSARDLSHTAVLNRRLMLPYFDLPQA